MEYLFLCSRGIDRSTTAAEVARKIILGKELDIETISDAFDDLEENHENLMEYLARFSRFYVMEEYMQKGLIDKYGIDKNKVVCLNIDDDYRRDKPEDKSKLETILENILRVEINWALKNS